MATRDSHSLRVVGLFAGIAGIERGLGESGHEAVLLCEVDDAAAAVLNDRVPAAPLHRNVTTLSELPDCDLLTAGFPCQDLSQAGKTAGISGSQSSLVEHVFRLVDTASEQPTWLLLENVSFMLSLDRGQAMSWLVERLEERGYTWAYRVVDTLSFGLPQRRQRVLLLASKEADPRPILLNEEEQPNLTADPGELGCGFYWTEGERGLGWAVDAIPTLKGGSGLGIPSPPAIWIPATGEIVTPHLRDAERLQGFPADWTLAAGGGGVRSAGRRWKLVGNAVSVPVARWVGRRLKSTEDYGPHSEMPLSDGRWPRAAWGHKGERRAVETTMWPVRWKRPHLLDFLEHPTSPLSARASAGFLSRAERGNLRMPEAFIEDVRSHLLQMKDERAALAA